MYYEYWGLKKPPFDNVPDPSMYVDCHSSMENAVAETLFAIEEGNECIAVIIGDVGLGKTLSIRMIIESLNQEKHKIALITNPGISFVQMLQEIIGQLIGKECAEKRKVNLLEIFNGLLFTALEEGKKILIFIDEANAITPVNLESLRLLTNMQGDGRNLFTMVLAGQIEFARRLEHPKRANFFQRVGTYSRIDKLESIDNVRKYVETRLNLAGATQQIFTDDSLAKIWEHSNQGIPRLINKLSKLCLKAGETNNFKFINGDIVDQIGARFNKLTGPAIQTRKPRKRIQEASPIDFVKKIDALFIREDDEFESNINEKNIAEGITFMTIYESEAYRADKIYLAANQESESNDVDTLSLIAPEEEKVEHEFEESDSIEEIQIGSFIVTINFPEHFIAQSRSSTPEHRFKLAGAIAAETLKKNPQLTTSYSTDPVPIWQEIRDFVLNRFNNDRAM